MRLEKKDEWGRHQWPHHPVELLDYDYNLVSILSKFVDLFNIEEWIRLSLLNLLVALLSLFPSVRDAKLWAWQRCSQRWNGLGIVWGYLGYFILSSILFVGRKQIIDKLSLWKSSIFVSCSLPLKVNGEKELSIMLSLLFLQTRITFIELNWSNELDESCLIEMIQQACKWILNVLKLIKGMYLLFIIRC